MPYTRGRRAVRGAETSNNTNRETSVNSDSVEKNGSVTVNVSPDDPIATTSKGVINSVGNRLESVSSGSEGRPWNNNKNCYVLIVT